APPRCRGARSTRAVSYSQSFDHLVGAGEQSGWHIDAENTGGLSVDHQLELGRLHDWQGRRLRSPEDATYIDAHLSPSIVDIGTIANQPTSFLNFARFRYHRNDMPRRKFASWTRRLVKKGSAARNSASSRAPFARHVNSLFRPSQPKSGLFNLARPPNGGNCNCSDRWLRTRIRCSRVGFPPTAPTGETATLLLTAGTTRGNGGDAKSFRAARHLPRRLRTMARHPHHPARGCAGLIGASWRLRMAWSGKGRQGELYVAKCARRALSFAIGEP